MKSQYSNQGMSDVKLCAQCTVSDHSEGLGISRDTVGDLGQTSFSEATSSSVNRYNTYPFMAARSRDKISRRPSEALDSA